MTDPSALPFVTAEYGRLAKWLVRQTGEVAKDVLDSVDKDSYGADDYAKAMGRLFSIGILGSIGFADATITAAALLDGKAPPKQRLFKSDDYTVAPVNSDRVISVAVPFTRSSPSQAIASALVTFEPPTLVSTLTTFKICVNATDLPSGLYFGAVRVGPADTGAVLDVEIVL